MNRITNLDQPLEWIFKYVQWHIKDKDFIEVSKECYSKIRTNYAEPSQKHYILCPNPMSKAYSLGALILNEKEKKGILEAVRLIILITSEASEEITFLQRLYYCKKYFNWDYTLTANDIVFNPSFSTNHKNSGRYN